MEYKVSIKKTLSGDITLAVRNDLDKKVSYVYFSADGDISLGLELLGVTMRRHFDTHLKEKFLEWVCEPVKG